MSDPRERVERIRKQVASGPERPLPAVREDLIFLLKWADELREALSEMRNAARHKDGCSKGIPLEGDPTAETRTPDGRPTRRMYAECECGMRQANDRAARLLHGPGFVEERAPGKPPKGQDQAL